MKNLKILFIFLVSACSINYAQTVGGSFVIGIPKNEFKANTDKLGYGLEIHGTFWEPNKQRPVTIGLNLGYLNYGRESQSRPLSHTIPDVRVDVNRNNSIANMHLLVQIAPFTGTWRPFLEVLGGGNYIFTTTEVKSERDWGNNENIAESTNFDDWSWSYGIGGGMLIKVWNNPDEKGTLYLNLKCRYLWSSESEYLTEGGIVINPANGAVDYYVNKSTTDLFTINIGVDYYF